VSKTRVKIGGGHHPLLATPPDPFNGCTTPGMVEQFADIVKHPVWDGDLISKVARSVLRDQGLVACCWGWNILTSEGVAVAMELGILKS